MNYNDDFNNEFNERKDKSLRPKPKPFSTPLYPKGPPKKRTYQAKKKFHRYVRYLVLSYPVLSFIVTRLICWLIYQTTGYIASLASFLLVLLASMICIFIYYYFSYQRAKEVEKKDTEYENKRYAEDPNYDSYYDPYFYNGKKDYY